MSNSNKLKNEIPIRGDLTVIVRSAITGEQIRKIEIRNKITFLTADVLVGLLAQRSTDGTIADSVMYTMRMGTSNTAASRADTNLGTPVIGKQLLDVNKITGLPGELELTATLESADANGQSLAEAGLFTKGSGAGVLDAPGIINTTPRMLARQTHPVIPKTSAITLDYSWRISFTA